MPERPSMFAPLRHKTFRSLWLATLVTNLGALMQVVGAGWLMTTLADSHNMVALVQASTSLPVMVFSVVAGVFADGFDRRTVMLVAQVHMMVVSLALATTAFFGLLNPWLLLTFTFLIGCGMALFNPSWQASMGDVVPRQDLPGAVTLHAVSFNMMRSLGPAVGGIVVAIAGAGAAFVLNTVAYLPLIVVLLRWKPARLPNRLPREGFGSAIQAGVRYVSMSPNLLRVTLRSCLFAFAAVAILALLPSVAAEFVGGGPLAYGTLLACFGLGAITTGPFNSRIRARFNNETIVRASSVGFACCSLVLGLSRNAVLSHLVLLPAGACWLLATSLFVASVQLSSPRWVAGRALSIFLAATYAGLAAGSWAWGAGADWVGLDWALGGAALLLLGCALLGLGQPMPDFNTLDLDPLDTFSEPVLKLDLRPSSGPIVVTINYCIDQTDIPAFLRLMTRRRQMRIRDGGRQWALLRDLGQPDLWIETYHVPTWVEYLRHNMRRTKADAENTAALHALHMGDGLPVVHRMIERQTVPLQDNTPLRPIAGV